MYNDIITITKHIDPETAANFSCLTSWTLRACATTLTRKYLAISEKSNNYVSDDFEDIFKHLYGRRRKGESSTQFYHRPMRISEYSPHLWRGLICFKKLSSPKNEYERVRTICSTFSQSKRRERHPSVPSYSNQQLIGFPYREP